MKISINKSALTLLLLFFTSQPSWSLDYTDPAVVAKLDFWRGSVRNQKNESVPIIGSTNRNILAAVENIKSGLIHIDAHQDSEYDALVKNCADIIKNVKEKNIRQTDLIKKSKLVLGIKLTALQLKDAEDNLVDKCNTFFEPSSINLKIDNLNKLKSTFNEAADKYLNIFANEANKDVLLKYFEKENPQSDQTAKPPAKKESSTKKSTGTSEKSR